MRNRTLLIGLDGATFTILNPLMEEGVMPFLKTFSASGVTAKLASVAPPLTPPAWTTVMTGRSPGNHGIFDFFRFNAGGHYLTLYNSRDVRCETIWSMVNRNGLRVVSLNFVMMSPARPVSGYIIPGWTSWRLMRREFQPAGFYEELAALPGFNLKELSMDLSTDEKAVEGCSEEEYENWIRFHIRREQRWFDIWRYLLKEDPCDLMAIVFDGVDKLQHLCWRFINPELFPAAASKTGQNLRALCLDYFRQLDDFLAETIALAGEDASVFIVSDHGFTTTREIFYLNTWLNRQGLLAWSGREYQRNSPGKLGTDLIARQPLLLDWTKTKAFGITPSSNGINICIAQGKEPNGIPPESYVAFRQELASGLLDFTDPVTGTPVVTRVGMREELFKGNEMMRAPDLTLTLRDNGFVSILKSDIVLEKRAEPVGTHHPDGIFIAGGKNIKKGETIYRFSILDVVPTLLYSLGLPVPVDLEGRVLTGAFRPELLASNPVQKGAPTAAVAPFPENNGAPDDDQTEIMARLKKLGYL